MNYFQNGRGDGVIILVLAAISVFLTLTKRYKFLLFTGGGSLAILAFTFINFQVRMTQVQSEMKESMKDNPFGGLGEAMLNTVQIQWGWAVLIIGAALLIAAALLKETASETESTQATSGVAFQPNRVARVRSKKSFIVPIITTISGFSLAAVYTKSVIPLIIAIPLVILLLFASRYTNRNFQKR